MIFTTLTIKRHCERSEAISLTVLGIASSQKHASRNDRRGNTP
jgi:hypothetical protein